MLCVELVICGLDCGGYDIVFLDGFGMDELNVFVVLCFDFECIVEFGCYFVFCLDMFEIVFYFFF